VSIPLAEALEGEIISADSRQVYRELEIGTAKPTPEQRARVPHHFIDEKSIRERWTAGDFGRAARLRINGVLARAHTPIVVGGSMLYLRAMLDGFYEGDEDEATDYAALRREMNERGIEDMYRELQDRDPDLAARTLRQDHHRILRGIAVHRGRHERLSELQKAASEPLAHTFGLFFLHGDREETYERVNHRVLEMVKAGLVEEVRKLWDEGLDEINCNALRTHGYQEVFPYLREEASKAEMIDAIQKAVRHYVKRQFTWFRREERALWIERTFHEAPEAVAERIATRFRTP